MLRWHHLLGVGLGLVAGFGILGLTAGGTHGTAPTTGPVLSECDGRIRELVLHYEPSSKTIVAAAYRDFLNYLDSDIIVDVVCPRHRDFEDLRAAVGAVRCRLRAIEVRHPITPWSRDRWVALATTSPNSPVTLLSPRGEAGSQIWPARAGDERVGDDLAAAFTPSVRSRRSGLYFDGGDLLTDGENVFVVPRALQRNLQHTVRAQEEFLEVLGCELKRKAILLDEAPDHHAAMFMVSVGRRTMLVGDPALARRFASAEPLASVLASLPGGPDFSPETQHSFDAVAAQCEASGYTVVRLPTIPARDGRTYLTYVNVLLDQQGPRRIVYAPIYRGAELLNAAAHAVWRQVGYEVRTVDCTDAYRHFGCLHCLVNVLRRDNPPF